MNKRNVLKIIPDEMLQAQAKICPVRKARSYICTATNSFWGLTGINGQERSRLSSEKGKVGEELVLIRVRNRNRKEQALMRER